MIKRKILVFVICLISLLAYVGPAYGATYAWATDGTHVTVGLDYASGLVAAQVNSAWIMSSYATKLRIYEYGTNRILSSDYIYEKGVTWTVGTNFYSNVPLAPGHFAVARLYYIDNSGNDVAQYDAFSYTYNLPTIVPVAPTGLSVSGSDGNLTLKWSANTTSDYVQNYKIYCNGSFLAQTTADVLTYSINGLSAGSYSYYITAVNGKGESSPSATVTSNVVLPVPSVPTGLKVTGIDGSGTLTWSANPSGDNVTSYNIYENGSKIGTSNGTSYIFSGLTSGTYQFTVSAVNLYGEGSQSTSVSFTVAPSTSSPTNLVATPGSSQVSLSWTAVSGATGYNVRKSTTAGGPYTISVAQNVPGVTALDNSVTAGTTYYYVVTALTSGGESANSNEASVTISPAPVTDRLFVLLDIAEQAQLSVTSILADNASLTWTSSDPTVATVDAYGKVTALKEGTCNIYAKKSDNSFSDYIPVKVIKNAESLRLALHLKPGESKRLWITDDPSSVTWKSMDPSVATVDNTGNVVGVANGLCIVQGVLSGKTYTIYVRVNA